ncbi:MAG: LamG-like jellyroll fold domain-containing protein [Candidatus Marinimicrobia bacterium]|nr:LamG-like jellyroll fold domain-containing protein [Candidatus Neomarinimicrobiota bacterium]
MKKYLLLVLVISVGLTGSLMAGNTYVLNLQDENHYFKIADNANNDLDLGSNFTIEAWIYINDATHGNERIFYSANWQMFVASGTGSSGANATVTVSGSDIGTISMSVPTEGWHHVCVNSNGTWANNYLDGSAVNNAGATTIGDVSYLRVGSYSSNTTDFQGAIDEIRISNITRYGQYSFSVSETDAPFTSDANTILLYHFDNNSEFPPGNSSSKVFTATNYNIDASDYFAWDDATFSGTDLSLPVTLSSFSARPSSAGVQLNWITSSEIENLGFNLYRSVDGNDIELISGFLKNNELQGHGNSTVEAAYSYYDSKVDPGQTYTYLLADVDYKNVETRHTKLMRTVTVSETELELPGRFTLSAAYPNPFNPSFTLPLTLDQAGAVRIDMFNQRGQLVETITNQYYATGYHEIQANGSHLATGVYLISCSIGNERVTQKVVLMK